MFASVSLPLPRQGFERTGQTLLQGIEHGENWARKLGRRRDTPGASERKRWSARAYRRLATPGLRREPRGRKTRILAECGPELTSRWLAWS